MEHSRNLYFHWKLCIVHKLKNIFLQLFALELDASWNIDTSSYLAAFLQLFALWLDASWNTGSDSATIFGTICIIIGRILKYCYRLTSSKLSKKGPPTRGWLVKALKVNTMSKMWGYMGSQLNHKKFYICWKWVWKYEKIVGAVWELLNSTANPAHFHSDWAGLAVLFSRELPNSFHDFFHIRRIYFF